MYSREKTCGTKRRFDTKEIAEGQMAKATGSDVGEYNAYFCDFCHYWHFGHRIGINRGWEKKQ
jgi:hypothetical protein